MQRSRRSGLHIFLAHLLRITVAVGIVALMALFGQWITPRWPLLDTVDQAFAVFGFAMMALAALACVLGVRHD